MIRLLPTAITLSSSEIESHLQQVKLRHTLIANFENLDVNCPDEADDERNLKNQLQNCQQPSSE
jgi:hypothetical protein